MITRGRDVRFARNYSLVENWRLRWEKRKKEKWSSSSFQYLPVWIPLTISSLMWRKERKRQKIEKSERWLGKRQVAEGQKKKEEKRKKKQSNPFTRFEADHSEGIMSSSHEGVPGHGSALTAGWFVCPFLPRIFFPSYIFNQNAFVKGMIGSTRHWWFSGRILTYQARSLASIPIRFS